MRIMRIVGACAFIALCSLAAPATAGPNGSIDISCVVAGVPDYGCCQANTLFFQFAIGQIQLQLHLRLGGLSACGISGAECYVQGLENLPVPWTCSATGEAGSTVVGNLCAPHDQDNDTVDDTRRGNVVFGVNGPLPEDGCRRGNGTFQNLALITIAATAPASNLGADMSVRVIAGDAPGSPDFPCPLVTLCDSPIFTKVCVTGGEFWINPVALSCHVATAGVGAPSADCPTTAVEDVTWTRVKHLYR